MPLPVTPTKNIEGFKTEPGAGVIVPPIVRFPSVFNVLIALRYKFVLVSVSGAHTSFAISPEGFVDVGNIT